MCGRSVFLLDFSFCRVVGAFFSRFGLVARQILASKSLGLPWIYACLEKGFGGASKKIKKMLQDEKVLC
jgi:hypothetical protein